MMVDLGVFKKTARKDGVRYRCPNCGDKGFHLYYNTSKNIGHCRNWPELRRDCDPSNPGKQLTNKG